MWSATSKQSHISPLETWKEVSSLVLSEEAHVAERFVSWPFDNASQHCHELNAAVWCGECPDQHIIWRLIQWAKVIVLKASRHYFAFPVVLALVPLIVGVTVGFWYGRSWERKQQRPMRRTDSRQGLGNSFSAILIGVAGSLLSPFVISKKPYRPPGSFPKTKDEMTERECEARHQLRRTQETLRESGVDESLLPHHVAVVMDGNRRYGKYVYGNATSGHWDGSRKLLEFSKWCLAERIKVLTVYAFSTENWCRDPVEIAELMSLFTKYCDELCTEALARNIRVRVLSSETSKIPLNVKRGLHRLESQTSECSGELLLNVCISYGSRGEIVDACRSLAKDCLTGRRNADSLTEAEFAEKLLTGDTPDPDILIRTSGEVRISNFLLWQLAYTELFFLDKNWPEIQKEDLLNIIRKYAMGRRRRFGR